jgi:hypothetical protein
MERYKCVLPLYLIYPLTGFFVGQKPDLVAAEAQITHSTRKINNAIKTKEEVARNEEKLAEKVGMLEKELASVRKAADAAQGTCHYFLYYRRVRVLTFGGIYLRRGITEGITT